ncbi:hypothetical protein VKT23_018911 [Stygiomarasmius scandens]|uniref:Uncharacterized protein n=1 Tax=Marasmiellus scandens TaxID=2682957 RepID=A0ABR1IMY4_9AGAR
MSSTFSSSYGSHRKRLIDLADRIRTHGAQQEFDVTQVVVIGNQSSGKSSVVEAISGINVPRDAGTCTRCPTHIRLTPAANFSARISILYSDKKDSRPRPFGGPITDKAKVEDVIRRAQLLALEPTLGMADLLIAPLEDIKELTVKHAEHTPFCRNVVSITVEGPGLTDLSFVDLPGLIQNAESKVVSLVEKMVMDYIKGNSIILVVLPMTDDMENQKALRLARTEDPQGLRTIGVLTKPDLLGPGSITAQERWKEVLEGRSRDSLGLGYFCTRQPDDAERALGATPTQARENEDAFFRNTSPWSSFIRREQFGIANLISVLNTQLTKRINDNLPRITQETEKRLRECRKELGSLPKPVEEAPATHMLGLITAFTDEIKLFVRGDVKAASLIQTHNDTYKIFKRNLAQTAPNFVPFLDAESYPYFTNCLDQDKEDEDTLVIIKGKGFTINQMTACIKRAKTRELPNHIPFEAVVELILQFQEEWNSHMLECLQAIDASIRKFLGKAVNQHFSRHDPLRRFINSIIVELVERKRKECHAHVDILLKSEQTPRTLHQNDFQELTKAWYSKYKTLREQRTDAANGSSRPQSPVKTQPKMQYSPSGRPMKPLRTKKATDMFSTTLDGATPSRYDSPASMSSSTSTNPENSSQDWKPAPAPPFADPSPSGLQEDDEEWNRILAKLAQRGLTVSPAHDDYEEELKTMAEVRSYFQISFKRLVDIIPSIIDLCFVKGLAKDVQPFLVSKFDLCTESANEKCAQYLAEDESIVAKREALLARKKMLENVQQELIDFGLHAD